MNTRIAICDKDVYYLTKLAKEGLADSHSQPQSYKDFVVLKPWGYEFLAFENEKVAIWFLYIKEGHSTSMHCHPNKSTTLAILNGEAFFTTFRQRQSLSRMDSVFIDKGVFHSTSSVSQNGIYLLELETPPNKTDLVRFNDAYGRAREGYEPTAQMTNKDLGRFGYFHFEEGAQQREFRSTGFYLAIEEYQGNEQFETFALKEDEKAMVCRGNVLFGEKTTVDLGDIFDSSFGSGQKAWIAEPVTLLKLRRGSP